MHYGKRKPVTEECSRIHAMSLAAVRPAVGALALLMLAAFQCGPQPAPASGAPSSSPTPGPGFDPAAFQKAAASLDSARSLLITDIGVVESRSQACDIGLRDANECTDSTGLGTFRSAFVAAVTGPGSRSISEAKAGRMAKKWLSGAGAARALAELAARNSNWMTGNGSPAERVLVTAPFRLNAVAIRPDLSPPELRLVFGAFSRSNGDVIPANVIFEYPLRLDETLAYRWAMSWASLSTDNMWKDRIWDAIRASLTFQSSARIRVNFDPSGGQWVMAEFSADSTGVRPAKLASTPAAATNCTPALAKFLSDPAISTLILQSDQPPSSLPIPPEIQTEQVGNALSPWHASGIGSDLRQKFALGTCDGCHGIETDTHFQHVANRTRGVASTLSAYLTSPAETPVANLKACGAASPNLNRASAKHNALDFRKSRLAAIIHNKKFLTTPRTKNYFTSMHSH